MKVGWRNETLGGIFEIGSSKRVLQKQWQNEGVPFYRAREIVKLAKQGSVENDLFISEEYFAELKETRGVPSAGDLMVSAVGTLGACYVVQPEDRFYFKDASVLRFHPKVDVCSRFYQYAFQWDGLLDTVKRSDGATVGTLTISRAKGISVPLPPLEEQRRIVAVLDEAFKGLVRARENAEVNLQNARELFPAILTALFTRTNENWSEKTLEHLCEKITDGTHQTPQYFDEGYIFLSSKNVTSGKIDWENIKYIDEAQHLAMQKRLSPQVGDVLLAKNGTTGVAAIVDRDVTFDIYVSLALLRSKGEISPEFLLYFTNSSLAKDQFNKRLKGSGVPNLHLKEIRKVRMPYPNSRETQEDMVRLFDRQLKECEAAIAKCEAKLRNVDDLRRSLLQKAFVGELT
ncbi:MAG: restriction endonuclease subunit S [Sulfitobacter sp.]|uniref:restriction endonuclease subunit S n=1 Tax=Sulfitobacter sp. TaxID=1903071 RepID=UPI003002580B